MSVTVISVYEVPLDREQDALAMWDRFAAYFRTQPGFISARLHRALNVDARFRLVNVAEWESAEKFNAARIRPELKEIAAVAAVPEVASYPALYEVIRA